MFLYSKSKVVKVSNFGAVTTCHVVLPKHVTDDVWLRVKLSIFGSIQTNSLRKSPVIISRCIRIVRSEEVIPEKTFALPRLASGLVSQMSRVLSSPQMSYMNRLRGREADIGAWQFWYNTPILSRTAKSA